MVQVKEIVVGERYEVQPKNFHRGVIGTVTRVENGSMLLKVENYDICDRGKVNAERLLEVNTSDIKYLIDDSCFFS
ncbi:MAG TPA: hypothetical protein PK268_06070 [Enterococcus sp.]|nr:hypothetical protein [Enterococcus sp.]HPR81437.1 hypothetical protein [Enterococcus sp.]